MINVNVNVKNIIYVKKIIFEILLHVTVKSVKYLANIIVDSTIICDEFIKSKDEEIQTVPTNFNKKKVTCKRKIFIFHLHFY